MDGAGCHGPASVVDRLSRARIFIDVWTCRAVKWRELCNVRSRFRVVHPYTEADMASEDRAAGKVKQAKGKMNEVAGAARGNTAQELKGKVQKGVGKMQSKLGKDR